MINIISQLRAKATVTVEAGKATAHGPAASKKPNRDRPPEGGYLKLTVGMAKFAECDNVTGAAWCTHALPDGDEVAQAWS